VLSTETQASPRLRSGGSFDAEEESCTRKHKRSWSLRGPAGRSTRGSKDREFKRFVELPERVPFPSASRSASSAV